MSQDKITSYESFIQDKLKTDLHEIQVLLDKKSEQHRMWLELKNFIRHVRERDTDELNVKFDAGHGVHLSARCEKLETLVVSIGCDCYLEMYYDEADKYVDIRLKYLKKEMEFLRGQAVKVKAHIKLVLLAIDELKT